MAAWPQHDLQRPPEKGTWPLPAQNSPSQCPLALEGVKFLSPFLVGAHEEWRAQGECWQKETRGYGGDGPGAKVETPGGP